MVRLISLVKRKQGVSVEEFRKYWAEQHGPFVASTKHGSWAVKYEQYHRALDDYARTGGEGYDGAVVQTFRSIEEFERSLQEDDVAAVWEDNAKFLDLEDMQVIITDDPIVVVDRTGQ
jgi:uncharacterized protein (TIGR02118 family)